MEQLNSMFIRLKRGLYAGGDSSQPPEKQQSLASSSSTHNDEDEGFVLISQNECDDKPSSEKMATHNLAPYSQMSSQDAARAGRDFAMFATCDLSMDSSSAADTHDHAQGITYHPAVIGVPFQINPKLREKDRLHNMLSQLNLESTRFDWQKYNYDFNFEQSSLRELCAMEKTMVMHSRSGRYVS